MTLTKAEKPFDCLEFKDRIQGRICKEIRDPTHEEEIEYFERSAQTGPLAHWWKKVRHASGKRPAPFTRMAGEK